MPSASEERYQFKAFLSHSYKAESTNIAFFGMFDDVADVQFEVDIGRGNLNVTRLERRMRECDAFVGLYPYPGGITENPSPEDVNEASRYFRLEIELAARAGLPSIIFYDRRFHPAIRPLRSFSALHFNAVDIEPPIPPAFRFRVQTAFKEFCQRLDADIRGRWAGFGARRDRNDVGLLVPRGKGGYSEAATSVISASGKGTIPIQKYSSVSRTT